jgi:hypothetical protein
LFSPVKINYILFDPKKNDLNPQKLILSTKEVGADEDYYSRPEEPAFGKL